MCQPYGRTPPPRTMWSTYFIYAAQKEQIGYVLHKVGEDETMQRNKGCRTTKGATGSRNAGGKMAEDIGIDKKNMTNDKGCRSKKGAREKEKGRYLQSQMSL